MVAKAKRSGWIALGSALVFHLGLLALQTNRIGSTGFMRAWLLEALVPGEKLVDSGFQGVAGVWDGYIALIGVRDQNQELQARNNLLQMQIQQQEEAIRVQQKGLQRQVAGIDTVVDAPDALPLAANS